MGLARASDIGKSVTYRRGGQYVSIKAASPRRLAALIKGSGRPLNLIRFNARQTKRGVSHRAYGRRQTAEGAFIGNSGRTVFVRKGRKRSAGVRPAWGPGLANVYAAHAKELRTLADKQYRAVHFPSRIRQELRRAGLLRGSSVA